MALIETYSKTDIQGRTYEYNLRQAENGSWFVDCWEIEKISEEEDSASHHWTTDGCHSLLAEGCTRRFDLECRSSNRFQ